MRDQITRNMSLSDLQVCADRYDVSLTALILKWLDITKQLSVFMYSIDGFILWAKSSRHAFKEGLFFRSGDPLPDSSLASKESDGVKEHPLNIWSEDFCAKEKTFYVSKYDRVITLITFE